MKKTRSKYYSIPQAARKLGLSRQWVWELVIRGDIPSKKLEIAGSRRDRYILSETAIRRFKKG